MTLPATHSIPQSINRSTAQVLLALACWLSPALADAAQGVTQATIRTELSGLKAFLPPLPTDLTTKQQNTVTVRTVRADGSADLENRFDRFDLESDRSARR